MPTNQLSLHNPLETKTCTENQKVWIIKAHSFIYRALFKYSNRAVTSTGWIIKCLDNRGLDIQGSTVYETYFSVVVAHVPVLS